MGKRIVFMGSPEFSVPILKGLADHYRLVGVVTQPDRPSGRGQVMTPPPVKLLAAALGIPIMQPLKLRSPEAFDQLVQWQPDLIIVAAFGQILRQNVLDLPKLGCINVHASYLPRWRGAAPIQAAIVAGDTETGITIMRMDAGVDTGPVFFQTKEPISEIDNASTLSEKLSQLGCKTLLAVLPDIIAGKMESHPQDELSASYAPMLKKEDGLINWSSSAIEIERKIRAFNEWPGTYFFWKNQPIKIRKVQIISGEGKEPGTHFIHQGLPAIMTEKNGLCLLEIQPAGKKWMSGKDFLNGNPDWKILI